MRPVTGLVRALVLLCALHSVAACGDRPVTDDAADDDIAPPPPPLDVGVEDDEGEVVCREGLVPCNGVCLDVSADDDNCGACGHACKQPNVYGHCVEGSCPSTRRCGGVDQGFVTCQDVCAFHGQTCDEGPATPSGGCGGGYRLHFDSDSLEECEVGFNVGTSVEATCMSPIDWSIEGGWDGEPAKAVSCCCTQDPPS